VRGILDVQDGFGNTALHLACVDGSEECVRMLIEVLETFSAVQCSFSSFFTAFFYEFIDVLGYTYMYKL